ncbi:synaptic vesicular amine transporter-like isoform X2 [Clavelina lepadiformis]|uniref:synaptic vesicular amine transporter-like isoform X2 n=1 Tax=Clavelina lepadiformis TaxID=159417 RepID=UPI004042BB03
MNLLQQMQSSKILAVVIVASIVFLDYTLTGAIVPIVPTLLWKIHLRSQLDLKESSHLDTSTNATSEATTVNMTLISPTAAAQNLQDAEKVYLATQGFALGQSYAVLLVSPAVQGIGSACNTAAGMTMLARTFPEEEQRGKIIGITFGMLGVGSAFGPPYGSVMTAFTGKEATFFLLAGLIALFGILQLFYNCLKIERIEQDEKPKNMWILLKDIDILIYLGVIFMGSVILGALNGTFTTWLIERFHPHNWELGLAFLPLFGLFGLASNMINFTPLKRWPIAVAVLGSVIFCIGLVALPFTPSFVSTIGPTLVIGLGIGLVTGSIYPDLAVLSETRHDSDYGNVYALADIAIMVGFFVGPLIGAGIVHALNFSWMMWILAIVSIVYALALAVRFYVTKKKTTQVEETQQLLDDPINNENNDEKEVS